MSGVRDEERTADLEEWQRRVAPSVERLIRDQEYRDYRVGEREKRWKRWAVRVAVAAGSLTVTGTVVRSVMEWVHLLRLP